MLLIFFGIPCNVDVYDLGTAALLMLMFFFGQPALLMSMIFGSPCTVDFYEFLGQLALLMFMILGRPALLMSMICWVTLHC